MGKWSQYFPAPGLRVSDVLERLYNERALSPRELALWRRPRSGPYKPEPTHKIHGAPVGDYSLMCGHNPVLHAQKVVDLRVIDEDTIEWKVVEPVHTAWLCEELGQAICANVGLEPARRKYRWQRKVGDRLDAPSVS